MEVHHHPIAIGSHPEHSSARKKWAHYLWEFLMLFFAVFAGFLAENQREHLVEHKRARSYAESLLKDLQSDTADIKRADHYETLTALMIDSLLSFTDNTSVYSKSGQLYYYMRLANSFYTVDWNKATINQLINSGNLRYFTDPALVTLISAYNTTSNMIVTQEKTIDMHRYRAIGFLDQIIKAQVFQNFLSFGMDDLIDGKKSSFIDSLRNKDLPLQSMDPALMNGYLNGLNATKSNRRYLKSRLYPRAIKEASGIMELLKKEYHLK